MSDEQPSPDRSSPVGEPVVRGDAELLGDRAREAAAFDPDDPESLAAAADVVYEFAVEPRVADAVYVLRGAAACAALVRGEGSYKAAAERAGEEVSVSFVRKWARVHDLPYSVRRHVARGDVVPTAAKHIARLEGDARFLLAWAVVDAGMTVREVRDAVGDVTDGRPVEEALEAQGVDTGRLTVELPDDLYLQLRRRASVADVDPDEILAAALADWLDGQEELPDAGRR